MGIINDILVKAQSKRSYEIMERCNFKNRTILITRATRHEIFREAQSLIGLVRYPTPEDATMDLNGHELIVADLPEGEKFRVLFNGD